MHAYRFMIHLIFNMLFRFGGKKIKDILEQNQGWEKQQE